jgi:hypothetical protein
MVLLHEDTQMTTKHSTDCKMVFGRKDASCPRCQELIAGAAPIKWAPSFAQRDAQACREVAAHFASARHLSGGCGPVCTFGEW